MAQPVGNPRKNAPAGQKLPIVLKKPAAGGKQRSVPQAPARPKQKPR